MVSHRTWMRGLLLASMACLWPATSDGHGNEPRTAVKFDDVGSCYLTVDRATATVLHLDYSIPMEDLPNPEHDLPDAKTHQFIAVCRDWSTRNPPPDYLTVDDLQRSIDIGYEEPERIEDLEATFETSPTWAGCWRRITDESDRLPLTPEAAQPGVDWDTTEFEAGVWYPVGHTFDPPWNVWRKAPYAVRIEDDLADPVEAPALVVAAPPKVIEHDETVVISACAGARGPSQVTFKVRSAKSEGDWTVIGTLDSPEDDPLIAFDLVAPEDAWGQALMLAMDLVDGDGRAIEGFAPSETIVLSAPAPTPENPFPEPPADDEDGGGCRVATAPDDLPLLTLLPLLLLRRARRRAPHPGDRPHGIGATREVDATATARPPGPPAPGTPAQRRETP